MVTVVALGQQEPDTYVTHVSHDSYLTLIHIK
jgi:hypothetical protein